MTTRTHAAPRPAIGAPIRPTSIRPPSSSHHARTTSASSATIEPPTLYPPNTQTLEPPPAPRSRLNRNPTGPHWASRPPGYAPARYDKRQVSNSSIPTSTTSTTTPALNSNPAFPQPHNSTSTASLSIPKSHPLARTTSRPRSRNRAPAPITPVAEEDDTYDEPPPPSSDPILIEEDSYSGLGSLHKAQADLLGPHTDEGEWEDEEEDGREKIDARILQLWKARNACVDEGDVKAALEESLREKVASLSADRWMWECESEGEDGD